MAFCWRMASHNGEYDCFTTAEFEKFIFKLAVTEHVGGLHILLHLPQFLLVSSAAAVVALARTRLIDE